MKEAPQRLTLEDLVEMQTGLPLTEEQAFPTPVLPTHEVVEGETIVSQEVNKP